MQKDLMAKDHYNPDFLGYSLAFLVALMLRLINLDGTPLSNIEAGWALQALDVSRGGVSAIGSNPGYVFLSAVAIFFFGESNAAARVVPALIGASLALPPFLVRDQIGRKVALILAFGLALDPLMVVFSRTAGGPILPLAFMVWAYVCLLKKHISQAGILFGLALLSGTDAFFGGLTLGVAYLVWRLLSGSKIETQQVLSSQPPASDLRGLVFPVALTIFFVGTMATLVPQGIGGIANQIPAFISRWVGSSTTPVMLPILVLVVYQPLLMVFGLMGGFRSLWDRLPILHLSGVWVLVSLVLILLSTGRQTADLVWVVFPMWVLASHEIAHWIDFDTNTLPQSIFQACLVFILLLVFWFTMASTLLVFSNPEQLALRWLLALGILVVGGAATALVGLGWSRKVAYQGLVWGLLFALGLFVIGEAIGATRLKPYRATELWQTAPSPGDVDYLLATVGDLSEWSTGRRDSLEVVAMKADDSLRWALRSFPNATFEDVVATNSIPPIILAPEEEPEPSLAIAYRGQAFDWQIYPGWSGAVPPDGLRWLIYRQAPVEVRRFTLWGRSDIFPGGEIIPQTPQSEQPVESEDELPPDSPLR